MNEVRLEINSYEEKARLLLNGKEPSIYSNLANYTYGQILDSPESIFSAIAHELNDDFKLYISGNTYEHYLIAKVAAENDYCLSCEHIPSKLNLSSKIRAERLSEVLTPKEFVVYVPNLLDVKETHNYGNITLYLSGQQSTDVDLEIKDPAVAENTKLMLDFCETELINPYIGKTVGSIVSCPNELAVCSKLNPILTASVFEKIEVGSALEIQVNIFPEDITLPEVEFVSSNPDVLMVNGKTICAMHPGIAELKGFITGENVPFFCRNIEVKKTISVSKIKIAEPKDVLLEGTNVELPIQLYPTDAEDVHSLILETSNQEIAIVDDKTLWLKAPGTCTITAKTTHTTVTKEITVLPKLKTLTLSEHEVSINVGGKMSIEVILTPDNAYDASYIWGTTDKTVAVVIEEDGKQMIKAVGIGKCMLTCYANDEVSDNCFVDVISILYKKKPGLFKRMFG